MAKRKAAPDLLPGAPDLAPAPMQSGGGDASAPWNSPFIGPFAGDLLSGSPAVDLSTVPDEAGLHNGQGGAVAPSGPYNDLMRYRHDFPFLPIVPIPDKFSSLVLVANEARYFEIPDGAIFARFKANNDFFASVHGNAQVPTDDESAKFSAFLPEDLFFYVGRTRAISFVSPYDAVVSGYFWFANERPTYDL